MICGHMPICALQIQEGGMKWEGGGEGARRGQGLGSVRGGGIEERLGSRQPQGLLLDNLT